MKPLIIIPARGGSKRLPRKNIKLLNGKPLIHYTIDAARKVFKDNIICISTEDNQIKKVAEETGLKVPFSRPRSLATDTSDTRSVLLHAYEYYKKNFLYNANVIILLQPTSPLRTDKHIKEALQLYNDELDMVVSVKETDANPYFVHYEEDEMGFLKKSKKGDFTRKQDCPNVWELNGAIYVIKVDAIVRGQYLNASKIIKYEMSKESSIDIDDEVDWTIAESLLEKVC